MKNNALLVWLFECGPSHFIFSSLLFLLILFQTPSVIAQQYSGESFGEAGLIDIAVNGLGRGEMVVEASPAVIVEGGRVDLPASDTVPGTQASMIGVMKLMNATVHGLVDPVEALALGQADNVGFMVINAAAGLDIRLRADQIVARVKRESACSALSACLLPSGSASIRNGVLIAQGREISLPENPEPNTVLHGVDYGLAGIDLILNEQVATEIDGQSIVTVNAVRLTFNIRRTNFLFVGEMVWAGAQLREILRSSDLTVETWAEPQTAVVGDPLLYGVRVRNDGANALSNVTMLDILPDSVDFLSISSADAMCNVTLPDVSCLWTELDSGEESEIFIRVTPTVVDTITNTVTVDTAEIDINPLNNEDSVDTLVIDPPVQQADLAFAMQAPAVATTSIPITLSGTVENIGMTSAQGVDLFLSLPGEVDEILADNGGVCSLQSQGQYLCQWPQLLPGETLGFTAFIAFDQPGTVVLGGQASTLTPEQDLQNNQDSHAVVVTADTSIPELSLMLLASSATAAAGESVVFEIEVVNSGGGADQVVVETLLSEDLIPQQMVIDNGGSCSLYDIVVTCEWPLLAGGQMGSIGLVTKLIADPLDTNIDVEASVYANDICPLYGAPCAEGVVTVTVTNF